MQTAGKLLNRRQFLFSCLRAGALAGLAALGGTLLARRLREPLAGQNCVSRGLCRGCAAFAGCGLPQALSAKRVSAPQVANGKRRDVDGWY